MYRFLLPVPRAVRREVVAQPDAELGEETLPQTDDPNPAEDSAVAEPAAGDDSEDENEVGLVSPLFFCFVYFRS